MTDYFFFKLKLLFLLKSTQNNIYLNLDRYNDYKQTLSNINCLYLKKIF